MTSPNAPAAVGAQADKLTERLAARAVTPSSPDYGAVRSTFMRGGSPGLVLRPGDVAGVVDAVGYASTRRDLALGIRSGGHGISGRSTNHGGIVIDVGRLKTVEVLDEPRRLVRIGPGARWGEVSRVLGHHGWGLVSGDHGGVGVGGLATAGGIGLLSRKYGLTIDHLTGVELVTADGQIVRADADRHPDLFWAVRGAGANFGLATAFDFTVPEIREVGWAELFFEVTDPAVFLHRFGQAASQAPRDTTAFLILGPGQPGQGVVGHVTAVVDSADPAQIVEQLQPLADVAPLLSQRVTIAPYAAVMATGSDERQLGWGEPNSRSGFAAALDDGVTSAAAELLAQGCVHFFQVRTLGGAIADVDPSATAYAHREAGFHITAMGIDAQQLDRSWDKLRAHLDGLYLSFESGDRPGRISDAFPPATLARLRALKREYDPDNLFADNFNITPSAG